MQFVIALLLSYGLVSTVGAGIAATAAQLVAGRGGGGLDAFLAAHARLQLLLGPWLSPLRAGAAILLTPSYFQAAMRLQAWIPIRQPGLLRIASLSLLFVANGLAGLAVASTGVRLACLVTGVPATSWLMCGGLK